jgi:hypothetical protein
MQIISVKLSLEFGCFSHIITRSMLPVRNPPPLAEAVVELELILPQHSALSLYSMRLKMLVDLVPNGFSSLQDSLQRPTGIF